ncbi:transposase-like protein [Paraburkholderia sp. EB58]|uniref:helix-turn-helix domain-containing protein n=1 Tax=Paraburkholderia sp. EB58 TaxID=3035125 RepID=UPI003D212FB8
MGRKSVLTPEQWAEIERRHLVDGESINSLAKEFGVNEGTIRKKIYPNRSERPKAEKPLSDLAREKVEADKRVKDISEKIAELPISRQQIVNDLARKLTNISEHLASAAEHSAASSHRLSILANQQLEKVDDVNPMASMAELGLAVTLQKMANTSSEIGLNLLRANKDTVDELNRRGADPDTGSGVAIYELPNNGRG